MALDAQFISDYTEIRLLNGLYNRLADLGDGENYAQLFTEDAEFEIVGNRVYKGRAEIAEVCSSTKVTVHITTEPEIDIDGDVARQSVRMMTVHASLDHTRNDFVSTGWYIDELHRKPEGWRYFRRSAQLDLDIQGVFEKMGISERYNELKSRVA